MKWETCEECKRLVEHLKELHVVAGRLRDPQDLQVNQEERKKLQDWLDGHRREARHEAV